MNENRYFIPGVAFEVNILDPDTDTRSTMTVVTDNENDSVASVAREIELRASDESVYEWIIVGIRELPWGRILIRETAAPDLLEAARFARGYINQTNPGGTDALQMLNNAIRKAEGRE